MIEGSWESKLLCMYESSGVDAKEYEETHERKDRLSIMCENVGRRAGCTVNVRHDSCKQRVSFTYKLTASEATK